MSELSMNAVILAGGSGTRFWPLSRRDRPKQFLALDQQQSLLQATVARLQRWIPPGQIWICTTEAHRAACIEQLPSIRPDQVLAEPEGRNTAPAIGWSIVSMPPESRRGVVGVFPADHRIADDEAFQDAVVAAAEVAHREDRVMTLGVVPRWPETGYGYLELGRVLDEATGLRHVVRFTEKPDAESATRFVDSGDYFWNPGIFVFRGETMLARLAQHEPQIAAGLEEIEADPVRLAEVYPRLPAISIDYGVMEKLDDLATLPVDCGWSDLGSWAALAELLGAAGGRNASTGDVVAVEAEGNLLWAEEGAIAVVGVDDLIVVKTGDAVLVIPRERSQEVRRIVDRLRAEGRDDLL